MGPFEGGTAMIRFGTIGFSNGLDTPPAGNRLDAFGLVDMKKVDLFYETRRVI
jgi:hypothetical protein